MAAVHLRKLWSLAVASKVRSRYSADMNTPATRPVSYHDLLDLPDNIVGEIISPSTHKHDRSTKREAYARERISHYWIVDPIERLIEVFERVDDRWILLLTARDDMKAPLAPYDEIPIDLGRLWA